MSDLHRGRASTGSCLTEAKNPQTLFLVKMGEITLKGDNRRFFEVRLIQNLRARILTSVPGSAANQTKIWIRSGRLYVEAPEEYFESVADSLATTFGIVGFSRAIRLEKSYEEIRRGSFALCREALKMDPSLSFKISSRRTDKSFFFELPRDSESSGG